MFLSLGLVFGDILSLMFEKAVTNITTHTLSLPYKFQNLTIGSPVLWSRVDRWHRPAASRYSASAKWSNASTRAAVTRRRHVRLRKVPDIVGTDRLGALFRSVEQTAAADRWLRAGRSIGTPPGTSPVVPLSIAFPHFLFHFSSTTVGFCRTWWSWLIS